MSSPYRCPNCMSFVSLERYINLESDFVSCRCCGLSIHCPTVYAMNCLPVVPASPVPLVSVKSILQPNGKIKKTKIRLDSPPGQLELFGGVL